MRAGRTVEHHGLVVHIQGDALIPKRMDHRTQLIGSDDDIRPGRSVSGNDERCLGSASAHGAFPIVRRA